MESELKGQLKEQLKELHHLLLSLHKALLDDERREYEKIHGPIHGANQILHLLMHDPWFDWLRQISRRIVRIDEILDAEKFSPEDASELLSSVQGLFRVQEKDSEFMIRYKAALKREPAAVLGHIGLKKCLQLTFN